MKKQLLLFLFIAIAPTCFSQTTHKVLINFNGHGNDFARTHERQFRYNFWFPSLEYQCVHNNRVFSFELAKFTRRTSGTTTAGIPSVIATYKDKNTQALIRFQYQKIGKIFSQDSIVTIRPYYGGALTPHYAHTGRTPLFSTLSPASTISRGVTAHASLGALFEFNRLFINANILIGLSQFENISKTYDDPSLSFEDQRNNFSKVNFLPKDNLFRIGIGIKL